MPELLSGEQVINVNRAANMRRSRLYVCPVCGNVLHAASGAAEAPGLSSSSCRMKGVRESIKNTSNGRVPVGGADMRGTSARLSSSMCAKSSRRESSASSRTRSLNRSRHAADMLGA